MNTSFWEKYKKLIFSITAGISLSWSIQLIRSLHFDNKNISQFLNDYGWRLLISGATGALIFAFLFWLTSKISSKKIQNHLQLFLLQFNIYVVYILLLGENPILFYVLLGMVVLISLLRLIFKDFCTACLSAGKIIELSSAILLIAYFSLIHLLYCGNANFFSITKTMFSVSFLAFPVLILNRGKIIYLSLLILLLMVFTIPLLYHMKTFGGPMPSGVYFAMFESPEAESMEYISSYLTLDLLGQILLFIALPLGLLFFLRKTKTPLKSKLFTQGGLVIAVLLILLSFSNKNDQNNVFHGYIYHFKKYRAEYKLFNDALAKRKNDKIIFSNLTIADSSIASSDEQTFVMIIGESTDRNHMSLFGYYRNTNPLLESMKNELFLFKDVISPHSHTQPSLRKVLTFANFEDMTPFFKDGTMIEIFKQAGFKTYWLSNQHFEGEFENATTSIATISDKYIFVNDSGNEKDSYDGTLIKPLKKVLKEKAKKKFIIIHLLGTHGNYVDRYPPEFNFFDQSTEKDIRTDNKPFLVHSEWGKDRINEYDNGVRYNDKVVYDIIQTVKKNTGYSYVTYFSDHGEEVYDCMPYCSHQETNATAFMFEIPFIVWCSQDYKKINKAKVDLFPHYLYRKYQTDDVIHSIIDLSNLALKKHVPSKSIFNPAFKEEKRIMNEQDYDVEKKRFTNYKMILQKNINPKNIITAGGNGTTGFQEMKKAIRENKNWITILQESADRDNISLDSALNAETRWALGQ